MAPLTAIQPLFGNITKKTLQNAILLIDWVRMPKVLVTEPTVM